MEGGTGRRRDTREGERRKVGYGGKRDRRKKRTRGRNEYYQNTLKCSQSMMVQSTQLRPTSLGSSLLIC